MSQQILLTLNDTAGNALGQYNINTAGSALHIQAVDGAYYQFTDPMTGIGPEGIITEREGDNLLVSFDEGTDLVIENYFAQNEPGALVGMQADGGLMSYPVATAPATTSSTRFRITSSASRRPTNTPASWSSSTPCPRPSAAKSAALRSAKRMAGGAKT